MLLIGLLVLSTLFYNFQEVTSLTYFVRFLDFACYFVIFFIILPKHILNSEKAFRKFVRLISFSGFIIAALGYCFLILGFNPKPIYSGYMISIIYHPNYVPFIVIFGTVSTLFYLEMWKSSLSTFVQYFYIISSVIQILAVLHTYSRQAYIGLGISLMVFYFLKYRMKFFYLLPIFGSAFLVLIPFFKAKGFGSFISRLYLLIPAYYLMFKDTNTLLWGYGFTNTFDIYSKYNSVYGGGEIMNNPHNSFVSMILMFGLPFTAILYITIVFLLLKFSIKSLISKNKREILLYGYFVTMIIAFIVLNLFESFVVQIEYFNMHLFMLFLGLMIMLPKYQKLPFVDGFLNNFKEPDYRYVLKNS